MWERDGGEEEVLLTRDGTHVALLQGASQCTRPQQKRKEELESGARQWGGIAFREQEIMDQKNCGSEAQQTIDSWTQRGGGHVRERGKGWLTG